MSKILAQLLGVGDPMFSLALKQLEDGSGNMGVDVQLTADIITSAHMAKRALGLDNNDTTPEELYHGLVGLAALHDTFLARRLGSDDPTNVADMLERIRIAATNVQVHRTVWAVKHSVIKRRIKALPPKVVQKALGYRSLDSMLKREPVPLILAAARILESPKWQKKFVETYAALTPLDFEQRELEILHPHTVKWQKLAAPHVKHMRHNLTHLKELGAVVILPLPVDRLAGVTLAVFPRVLHYMQELRTYSTFFKLHQVQPNFGELLVATIQDDPGNHISMAGLPIHWRTVHRHFGKYAEEELLPQLFEPHVVYEDLQWRSAESLLYELEPALKFWDGLDYVGVVVGADTSPIPVSCALGDVAAAYVNNLPFTQRPVAHLHHSLQNELYQRYAAHPVFAAGILRQLEQLTRQPSVEFEFTTEVLN